MCVCICIYVKVYVCVYLYEYIYISLYIYYTSRIFMDAAAGNPSRTGPCGLQGTEASLEMWSLELKNHGKSPLHGGKNIG